MTTKDDRFTLMLTTKNMAEIITSMLSQDWIKLGLKSLSDEEAAKKLIEAHFHQYFRNMPPEVVIFTKVVGIFRKYESGESKIKSYADVVNVIGNFLFDMLKKPSVLE